jgi:hypothetical protein
MLDFLIVLAGLVLILVGCYGVYSAWGRFNTGLKSAEKMAPLFTSAFTAIIGVIVLFRWLDIWVAIIGVALFGLGYLLRGPTSARNR